MLPFPASLTSTALVTLAGTLAIVWAIVKAALLMHSRQTLGLTWSIQENGEASLVSSEIPSGPTKLSKCQSKNDVKSSLPKNCKGQHQLVQEKHEVEASSKLSKNPKKKSKQVVKQKKQKCHTSIQSPLDEVTHNYLPTIREEEPAKGHADQDTSCTVAPKFIAETSATDDHEALDGSNAAVEGMCACGVLENFSQSTSTQGADFDVLQDLQKNVVAAMEHDLMEAMESDLLQGFERDLQSCTTSQHASLELQLKHIDDTAVELSPNIAVSEAGQEHEMSKQEDALRVYELDDAGQPVLWFTCPPPTDIGASVTDKLLSESRKPGCSPGEHQVSRTSEIIYFHHEDMPFHLGQHIEHHGSSESPAQDSVIMADSLEVVSHSQCHGLQLADSLNPDPPHGLDLANSVDPDHRPILDSKGFVDPDPPPGLDLIEYPPPGLDPIDSLDDNLNSGSYLKDSLDPGPPPGPELTDFMDRPPGLHMSPPAITGAAEVSDKDPSELQSLLLSINLELKRVASNFGTDFGGSPTFMQATQSNLLVQGEAGEGFSHTTWAEYPALWESLNTPSRGAEQYTLDSMPFGDHSMYETPAPHVSSVVSDKKYTQQFVDSSALLDHLSLM
eukprot:gnl/MRDRNA2_/MRDRNA2_55119_c0_seq2.p1 gnl/MRDRNA2_/MRDRNA2_55119_c0~~gnl/MRDRNA2_/MRDRNA2_55119_c0_seq2.p1  ORF type:complete len:616 (+),score=114.49 gnl/MRDRNA2_/MRDRNA2_55119_c0_seq2:115-1962(+)